MTHTDGIKNVEGLINRFGGMRPMARKIDVPVSTIQGWKKRDFVPAERVDDIIRAARNYRVSLDGFDIPTASNENGATSEPQSEPPKTETPPRPMAEPSPLRPRPDQQRQYNPSQRPKSEYVFDERKIKSAAVKRSIITTLVVLGVCGGLGFMLFGQEAQQLNQVVRNQDEMDRRLSEFRTEYSSFETTVSDGINNLNSRVSDVAAAVGVTRDSDGNIILQDGMTVNERLTAVESRLRAAGEDIDLGQLVTRFDNLTQAVQGQGDTETAMADMKAIIDTLQGRIGEMDAALEQAKAENAELAESLQGVTGRDISAAAMLLALTQMRDSLNRAEPFAEDLKILQQLVGEDDPELTAAINRLAPYAESGVLTPQGLSAELRGLTGEIIAASLRGEDVSIQEKMTARLGQILSVEKDGKPIMGTEEQAIIATAQAALDRGDVAAAVAELNKLEGDAAQAASPVTAQAMGTLNAQNAVDMLMQNLVQKIQDPQQLQGMIQSIPQEIKNRLQGNQPIILSE